MAYEQFCIVGVNGVVVEVDTPSVEMNDFLYLFCLVMVVLGCHYS